MGYITQAANKINTFKKMLIGGTAVEARMAEAVTNGAGKWGARLAGGRAAASEFAGAGIRGGALNDMKLAYKGARESKGFFGSSMAALDTIGRDTFQKGYGPGGYTKNILGGAVLGGAGGHTLHAIKVPSTLLGNAGKAFKAGWQA
jgi:hypothetical protein